MSNRPADAQPSRSASWHIAFALLGFVQTGLAPILLPLSGHGGLTAGATYGAFALAGLSAPILGAWSDRTRRNRSLFVAGLIVGGIATALAAVFPALGWRLLLAFAIGLGTMAASTTGTMLVVETTPRGAWDAQIGSLQSWGAGGQIAGLLLAGATATTDPGAAYLAGGIALLSAALLAWIKAPMPAATVHRSGLPARPSPGGEASSASPGRHLHQIGHNGIDAVRAATTSPLGRFLGVWLLSYTATNAVAVLFPIAMLHEFKASSSAAAISYATGIAASLAVYRYSAALDASSGARTSLCLGLLGRGAALTAMAVLGAWKGAGMEWVVWALLGLFATTQTIWPLLNVSSNTLAVTLHPSDRGESLGLLNATSSAGSVLGSLAGGAVVQLAGFPALCGIAVVAVAASAALIRGHKQPAR